MDDVEQQSAPVLSPGRPDRSPSRAGKAAVRHLPARPRDAKRSPTSPTTTSSTARPSSRRTASRSSSSRRSATASRRSSASTSTSPAPRYQMTAGDSQRERPALLAGRQAALLHLGPQGPGQHLQPRPGHRQAPPAHRRRHRRLHAHRARASTDGKERLVFNGYWKMSFDLYVTNDRRAGQGGRRRSRDPGRARPGAKDLPHFEPDIQVTLDDANKEKYREPQVLPRGRRDLHRRRQRPDLPRPHPALLLGLPGRPPDHRQPELGRRASRTSTSSTPTSPTACSGRSRLFDTRQLYHRPAIRRRPHHPGRADLRGRPAPSPRSSIPFSFYHRAELGVGYICRKDVDQRFARSVGRQRRLPSSFGRDNFPVVQGALVGDSARLRRATAPISGRRWRLDGCLRAGPAAERHAVHRRSTSTSGSTSRSPSAATSRSASSPASRTATRPTPYYFGGLDTVRGIDFRSLVRRPRLLRQRRVPLPADRRRRDADPGLPGHPRRRLLRRRRRLVPRRSRRSSSTTPTPSGCRTPSPPTAGASPSSFIGLDLNWDFAQAVRPQALDGGFQTAFWIGTRF